MKYKARKFRAKKCVQEVYLPQASDPPGKYLWFSQNAKLYIRFNPTDS
jgi:hypothetical protein